MALTSKLQAIGAAIREKTGKADLLTLDEMPGEILAIQTGSTDVPFEFGGLNAEKVASYSQTFTIADTSFNANSATSTSATSIRATESNKFTTPTLAIGDKDVVVVQRVDVTPTHSASATSKAREIRYSYTHLAQISKRRTPASEAKNTRQVVSESVSNIRYYNTSGVETVATAAYGLYATPQAPSVASSTAANTTVRVSTPVLYYRVSSTYESAANMKAVTECEWEWTVDVYLVDKASTTAAVLLDDIFERLYS